MLYLNIYSLNEFNLKLKVTCWMSTLKWTRPTFNRWDSQDWNIQQIKFASRAADTYQHDALAVNLERKTRFLLIIFPKNKKILLIFLTLSQEMLSLVSQRRMTFLWWIYQIEVKLINFSIQLSVIWLKLIGNADMQ